MSGDSPVFVARYGGTCGECDGAIRPGQQVLYVDDELAHLSCPRPAATGTCPHCWTQRSVSGACACDA